ncbi:cytochrome P450 [Circinella umbellata]|nr:cytochrome P450 [Circinella umbellata]
MNSESLLTRVGLSSSWNKGASLLTFVSNALLNQLGNVSSDKKRLTLITGAVATTTFVLWKMMIPRRSKTLKIEMVSGGLPYFGHYFELLRDHQAFIKRCKKEKGPVFAIRINNENFTIVTGSLIREMLHKSRYFNFEEGIQSIIPIERALQVSYDHKYKGEKLSRREKNPVSYPIKHNFQEEQLGVFSERLQLAVDKVLSAKLNIQPGEKKTLPAWETLALTVSQISCLCFCGSKIGCNQEFVLAMANFTKNVIRIGIALTVLPNWIANFIIKRYLSVESQIDLIMDLVVPELEKIRAGEISHDQEPTYISMALDLPKAGGQLRTPKEAAFAFKSVVLASIHTTTQTASFALHELACRPDLVADLRAEIEKLDKITPETVGEIRLLDSLLREVLRYDISIFGMNHKVMEDVILSTGQVIPRGQLVHGAMFDAHTSPETMPETSHISSTPLDQFDAYRFLNAKDNNMTSSSINSEFMTFGLFGHACPGRFFAVHEIKYLLAVLIMRYNITTKSGERAQDFLMRGMTRFPPTESLIFEGRKE